MGKGKANSFLKRKVEERKKLLSGKDQDVVSDQK